MQEVTIQQLTEQDGLFCDGDWIESKDQAKDGDIRLIQLADIGDGSFTDKSARFLSKSTAERLNCTYLKQGDILIARMPDPLGRACIFPLNEEEKYVTAVDVAILRLSCDVADNRYVCYILNSPQIRQKIMELQSGTTRKRISRKNLCTICMPLPKIEVQRQAVIRIEELLSELDKGITELKKASEQLNSFRLSVYRDAYHHIRKLVSMSNLFDVSGGLTKNSKHINQDTVRPYLRVGNVYYNHLDLREIKEIAVNESDINKSLLQKGDLLIVEGNGSKEQIGRVAIWDGSIQGCLHQNHIIKARPNGDMRSKYALYYLMSVDGRQQIMNVASSTSGLYTLSISKINKLQVPMCSLEEQDYIISTIESRLSLCDNIEKSVNESLQKAEPLRQSILKQAFEGKLV